jgi:hypothetical protein
MFRDCGCCEDDEIYFESDEQAEEAVREIGLQNGAVLVDAKRVRHESLDSFYGIRRVEIEEKRNNFQILADQILKNS